MSKIPYSFTGIPNFLIDNGWIKDHKTLVLFVHLFRRIRYEPHIEVINGREILLEPFEFMFGRDSVSEEIGLTPREIRTRIKQITTSKMAIKVTSKSTSKYTVYRWVKEHFCKINDHQSDQQIDQQNDIKTTSNRSTKKIEDLKIEDTKISPPPTPKSEKGGGGGKRAFHFEGEVSEKAIAAHKKTLKYKIPILPDIIQKWINDYTLDAVVIQLEATFEEVTRGKVLGFPARYVGQRLFNNHIKIQKEGKIHDIRSTFA